MLRYLRRRYPLREADDRAREVVRLNAMAEGERAPEVFAYWVPNDGAGQALHECQEKVFRGKPILVGIEARSGAFYVEGCGRLWDELNAFRGLGEAELTNFFLVAQYLSSLRRFGLLADAFRPDAEEPHVGSGMGSSNGRTDHGGDATWISFPGKN